MKKIIAVWIAFILFCTTPVYAKAQSAISETETVQSESTEQTEEEVQSEGTDRQTKGKEQDENTDRKNETEQNNTASLQLQAKAAVLMEASSGTIVYCENESARMSPASITKIMTLILIFDAIHAGKIKLDNLATTSAYAKSMGGSQVFLEEGEQQTVETLIKCIVVASGNDASVTMAEMIGGSEEQFVQMMNQRAEELGMTDTHFEDCCGLTDSDGHYTSAKDVAIMSRELITKYPEIFQYSTIWMETITHRTNRGESEFVLSNTNKLLKTNQYVKGLKTGSTSKAKYCVSTVAEKDGVELIAVVMAAPDYKLRFAESEKLLNYGFSNCKVYKDENAYEQDVNLTNGKQSTIKIGSEGFAYVDTTGSDLSQIVPKVRPLPNIVAPIAKGDVVGMVEYEMNGKNIGTANLVARETVEQADYSYIFWRLLGTVFQVA